MSEPSSQKFARKPYIYSAVVVFVVGISLLAAFLLGVFDKRGHIEADDICRNVPNQSEAAKVFNSVLPKESEYHFVETSRSDAYWGFRSGCRVKGTSGTTLLSLDVEPSPAAPWQQWVKSHVPPNDGGKLSSFNAGLKGVANTQVAAIWVPCYAHESTSKARYNMTVLADALKPLEVSGGDARQALIDLATSFARQAHKDAKCDLPSQLPD
ncbi:MULTISPECIES: hypothetical protein [unclassified Streptomyces]|uniref:hypothetical protein n=1 Tax=unclassified Streptomyces TaxID=2593676 RepID=UPI0037F8E5E5